MERAPDRQKEDSLEGFSGDGRELFIFKHLFYTTHDTTTKVGCQVFFGTKFLFFVRKIQRADGGACHGSSAIPPRPAGHSPRLTDDSPVEQKYEMRRQG